MDILIFISKDFLFFINSEAKSARSKMKPLLRWDLFIKIAQPNKFGHATPPNPSGLRPPPLLRKGCNKKV